MIRASHLKLPPPKPPVRSIAPWLVLALIVLGAAVSWWLHIMAAAIVLTVLTTIIAVGFVAVSFERRRQRKEAARLPRDATCTYARSFDFRHTDTLVMRAVYEELQPFVGFPVQASHRLWEDLKIDDEDLNLDVASIIAQRLHRTL